MAKKQTKNEAVMVENTGIEKTNIKTMSYEELNNIITNGFRVVNDNLKPEVIDLSAIAGHLKKIEEYLGTLAAVTACNHAPKIVQGVKYCPFCEVAIGKNKSNPKIENVGALSDD